MSGQEEEATLFGAWPALHWSGGVVGGPGREADSNLHALGMASCFCVLLHASVCVRTCVRVRYCKCARICLK